MKRLILALLGLGLDSVRRLRSARSATGAVVVLYVGALQAAVVPPLLLVLALAWLASWAGEALEATSRATFAAADALTGCFGAHARRVLAWAGVEP